MSKEKQTPKTRPIQMTTLHFDLSHSGPTENYQLHYCGKRKDLKLHVSQSRKTACVENPGIAAMSAQSLEKVTHYVTEVELPADVVAHCYVTKKTTGLAINELAPLSLSFIHIPTEALEACRRKNLEFVTTIQGDPRFKECGIDIPNDIEKTLAIQSGLDRFHNVRSAAQAVVKQHPQLAAQDKDTAAQVLTKHIIPADGMGELITAISSQGRDGWATIEPSVKKNGEPITWSDRYGERSGKTVYHYKLTDKTANALVSPTSNACTTSQNDLKLKNKKWTVNQGTPNEIVHPTDSSNRMAERSNASFMSSFVLNNKTPGHGLEFVGNTLNYVPGNSDTDPAQFSINIVNSYLRTMWAWVQYLDKQGNVIDSKGIIQHKDYYEQIGLGVVNAVNTILAIPVPGSQNLSFPWPEKATSVRIINAGLGKNINQGDLAWRGILLTALFQYAVPIVLLAAGAALEKGDYYKKWANNKVVLQLLFSTIESITGSLASQGPSLDNGIGVLAGIENGLSGFIVSSAAGRIAFYIAEKTTEAEIIDSVPIVGWVARVASMVITAASILETTIEVATSPSIYEVEVKRVVKLNVSVLPDPIKGTPSVPATWPEAASGGHYLFQVQYKDGTNFSQQGPMFDTTSSTEIVGKFPQLPSGGRFQVIFGVYSKDNWLAGRWTSGWFDALPTQDGSAITIQGAIIQSLAKLTPETVYQYEQSLRFENGAHIWKKDRPNAVKKDLKCGTEPLAMCEPSNITINDKAYMLGYSWQSAGMNLSPCTIGNTTAPNAAQSNLLYAFQNINIGVTPEASLKYPSCGFTGKPAIIYDQFGPAPLLSVPLTEGPILDSKTISDVLKTAFEAVHKPLPKEATVSVVTPTAEWTIAWPTLANPGYVIRRSPIAIEVHAYPSALFSQRNYYVDPRNGEYHLRKITLDNSTPFDMERKLSWGRFNFAHLDAFGIHPAGYAIGVSFSAHRLDIIKLPKEGAPDKDAPRALTLAGKGSRQGLLLGPNAMSIASDGRILIMETGNQRIQAFDINGNPTPSFDGPAITTLSDVSAVSTLDAKHLPMAIRAGFAAANVHLSARWLLGSGSNQIQVDEDGNQLALRRDGADLSTKWTITDEQNSYSLKLVDDLVVVSVPGSSGFTLPKDSELALDRGDITSEIRTAFSTNTITLSPKASVIGNGLFVQRGAVEEALALGQISSEITNALKTRNITLDADAKVHDVVEVRIIKQGEQWIVRDAPHANSYKISLSADHNSLEVIEYLPYFLLHQPDGRFYTSLSTELKGYMYVLSHLGDGNSVSDYALDIYEPNGKWLSVTTGVNAAKLVVNQWRTVYTLDYQSFAGPGGRTEPSVSTWIPSTNETNQ